MKQFSARWQALSLREQRGLIVLATLLGAWAFWAIAIAPAWQSLSSSSTHRASLAQQQSHMLGLQAQTLTLQKRVPLSRDEALRNLQTLTQAAGTQLQLNVQGDRVMVQVRAAPAPVLANWLAQARSQAQALPVEAHLTQGPKAPNVATAVWQGSLVLSLPGH
jgi:general secretion pathway protein M